MLSALPEVNLTSLPPGHKQVNQKVSQRFTKHSVMHPTLNVFLLCEQFFLFRNWIEECKNAEAKGRKPSFSKAFWKTFSKIFIFFGFLVAITVCFTDIIQFWLL